MKFAFLAMPLTAAILVLAAFVLGRARDEGGINLSEGIIGEYGRFGPVQTPEAKPAAGPYPFDAWLTLPSGTLELNRISGREGREDIFFVELLVPAAAALDFSKLQDHARSRGYTSKPVEGAPEGFQFVLERDRSLVEHGAILLVESTPQHQKIWVQIVRFDGGR